MHGPRGGEGWATKGPRETGPGEFPACQRRRSGLLNAQHQIVLADASAPIFRGRRFTGVIGVRPRLLVDGAGEDEVRLWSDQIARSPATTQGIRVNSRNVQPMRATSCPCMMQVESVVLGDIRVFREGHPEGPPNGAFSGGPVKRHTQLGVEEGFFDNAPRDSSRVKRQIVTEYFDYYMRVMARNGKTAGYVDLFAGPGIYGRGEESIPIVICKRVVSDPRLRTSVKLWFNEGDPVNFEKLKTNVDTLPGIASLAYAPRITPHIISEDFAPRLSGMRTPSFIFADPCGYKGISLRLIASALKPFGNDCIFFLNYNRINMKISYSIMNDSIDAFFEAARADQVREEIRTIDSPQERERVILAAVTKALEVQVHANCLPFGFRTREGGGTSHHLVYATKNVRALNQMKRIYTKASSDKSDGVGSLDYDPRDSEPRTLSLFSPLDEVRQRVAQIFAGRTLTFDELILAEAHTKFTDTAYRNALLDLEEESRVTMNPPAQQRRLRPGGKRRSLRGATSITFPA
jgi:three-Cys-motif partner protein